MQRIARRKTKTVVMVLLGCALIAAGCSDPTVLTSAPEPSVDPATTLDIDEQPTGDTPTTESTGSLGDADPSTSSSRPDTSADVAANTTLGAEHLVASDFAILDGERVGLITNQVSMVDGRHLIDWLSEAPNVELVTIFAAEHGVRGVAGAGEPIGDGVDDTTGTPIRSLYGATREPTADMLAGLDTVVFDLQDVGARFYTYTATMGLAMQAAAAADLRFVVLDRPNPLGRIVDGDLRAGDQTSFISQYPVPSLHGLTAGELALMIKGEAWLPGLDSLELDVVEMSGWAGGPWAETAIDWIPPSPGLQTAASATTYPATVWFEATTLSYGAGTELAFQAVGAPWLDAEAVIADLESRALTGVAFELVELRPTVIPDIASDPRFAGDVMPGVHVVVTDNATFRPSATGIHLLEAIINAAPDQTVIDRGAVFDLLAGTADVRQSLLGGIPADEIVADWADVAAEFEARSFAFQLY